MFIKNIKAELVMLAACIWRCLIQIWSWTQLCQWSFFIQFPRLIVPHHIRAMLCTFDRESCGGMVDHEAYSLWGV